MSSSSTTLNDQRPINVMSHVPRLCIFVGVFLVAVIRLQAQSPGQKPPAFEVASVKINASGNGATNGRLAGANFAMTNETLWRLIGEAYADPKALPRFRIIGGPNWIDADRFDVEGVAAKPLDRPQAELMLRTLLAERF